MVLCIQADTQTDTHTYTTCVFVFDMYTQKEKHMYQIICTYKSQKYKREEKPTNKSIKYIIEIPKLIFPNKK